ncbi:MAG: hypothetical protein JNJ72_20320, partial [Anaerolineales bacterium]|nr:hypothetical protein [Anaerolineales bacterium]
SAARDHGVPQEANARFAERIIKAPYRFKNQIGEFTAADVEGLFEAAWSGQVT